MTLCHLFRASRSLLEMFWSWLVELYVYPLSCKRGENDCCAP